MMQESMNSLDAQALADESRLGELLISVGQLQTSELNEALQICEQTGLGLGRVLVLSQYISEKLLESALQCQSLLRNNRLDMAGTKKVMQGIATGSFRSTEDALASIGQAQGEEPENKLGDLLVESGLVTKPQLAGALAQTEETGLPFGRLLVLSGVLTDAVMTSALNAQSAFLAGKVTKDQAIKSLKSSVRRTAAAGSGPAERNFYQLPDRRSLLMGELLIMAGLLTKEQLNDSSEVSVGNGKSLGQVLVESNLLQEQALKDTLELQELVMSNKCSTTDAARVLSVTAQEHISVIAALQKLNTNQTDVSNSKKVTFVEFLKLLGVVDDDAVNKAMTMGKENAHVMMQLLMFAKVCDPNYLHLAASCNAMMEQGRLTVEHGFVLFDYARKKRINIDQALKELNWSQGDITKAIENANADAEWEILRRQADQILQGGNLVEAERLWLEVVRKAEPLGGKEGPRFVCSLERLADVYTKQNKMAQAESLYSEALITKTRVLPPHSLHTAGSVNNMAKVCYFQGKYDDAERFALRFLELYKANFPHNHPDVACALQNVATLYHMQEKYNLAEPYYTEAVRICQAQLGEEHPTTVRMRQNYARLLQQMKRFREADNIDARVQGAVTGSWKAVTVPSDHMLYKYPDKLDE
jgi:tetratricopeptide (TPR) repeat protein